MVSPAAFFFLRSSGQLSSRSKGQFDSGQSAELVIVCGGRPGRLASAAEVDEEIT